LTKPVALNLTGGGVHAGNLSLARDAVFLVFGALSDRIGRKRIMLAGCLLAALTYVPLYMAMKRLANPDMASTVTSLPWDRQAGLVAILFVQMLYVTMVYGPIAAYLVELFPTSIRYTSMSLPYHLGNGWFGGFLPLIATALTTSEWARSRFGEGAIYTGLIYPIAVCLMTLVVGGLFVRETKDHKIDTPIR
jgi:MFS family permease